ncbi:hypothetical protein J6590_055374 [Homalodisca vitripennis]|nr:hypothetical protein J6590_055374 [Homalodisca vitripennis]
MRALGRTGRKRRVGRVGRQSDYLRKRTFEQILRVGSVGDVGSVPSGVIENLIKTPKTSLAWRGGSVLMRAPYLKISNRPFCRFRQFRPFHRSAREA